MATIRMKDFTRELQAALQTHPERVVEAFARNTEGEAKKLILRGKKTGETYLVPGTKVQYRASAPGEAPAPRTGDLANSINVDIISRVEAAVGSELKYALIEFGTATIAPRPYLRPAHEKTMGIKENLIRKALRGAT